MKIESVLLRLLLPGLETENFSKVKDLKTTNIDINTMTIIIITIHDDDDQPASLLKPTTTTFFESKRFQNHHHHKHHKHHDHCHDHQNQNYDDDDQPASLLTEHTSIPIGKSLPKNAYFKSNPRPRIRIEKPVQKKE